MVEPPGELAATKARGSESFRRWLRFWRSPSDQPRWARPALLAVAVVAALSYGWGMGSVSLEPFYGAAARSMSESWHNFFFGAVDPWGTVSVDKLPGALWLQALSLRIFGFHLWAVVLPQVIEGVLTVLVLFRAVRRLAGPVAGLGAAIVLAASPIVVLLNRGNVSDSLLILLLVLAADATSKAMVTGRMRSLLLAGLWVGLAFQAKMLQAWLVLPALYLAYLIAAPTASVVRRFGHVALSGLIVCAVSLSWMTVVALVPAQSRPYVDGSCDNSAYSQAFLYNGLDRFSGNELDQAGCSKPSGYFAAASKEGLTPGLGTTSIPAGWDRLLKGVFGRDDAWLVLPSLVAAAGLLVLRRRRSRTDPIRAGTALWSGWLLISGVFFSTGHYLNSYYVAALIPAMAALCGMGAAAAWELRDRPTTRWVVMATVLASAGYAWFLVPGYVGLRPFIIASILLASGSAVMVLALSFSRRQRISGTATAGLLLSAVALLLSSVWASVLVVQDGLGPFDSPYEPSSVIQASQAQRQEEQADWSTLNPAIQDVPANISIEAIEGSAGAGVLIFGTGKEFLPVGGFTGQVPAPSLAQFVDYVQQGRIPRATVAVQPQTNNPVMRWVIENCLEVTSARSGYVILGTRFQQFLCAPADIEARRAR